MFARANEGGRKSPNPLLRDSGDQDRMGREIEYQLAYQQQSENEKQQLE